MKVAIHQPYFFPYLGYFSMIKNVDLFICMDTVQFISRGWIARNRILKPEVSWQYINVPLKKHSRVAKIQNVEINNSIPWEKRILDQLEHYKKKAPYYNNVISILNNVFSRKFVYISELNIEATQLVCDYLGIVTKIKVLSQMEIDFQTPKTADEWCLNICKEIGGVDEYWNASGGKSFYDVSKYATVDIDVKFQKMILKPYIQKGLLFEPGLSIIDVMMFNSPEEINEMLDGFEFI